MNNAKVTLELLDEIWFCYNQKGNTDFPLFTNTLYDEIVRECNNKGYQIINTIDNNEN